MKKRKTPYDAATVEIIDFACADIITTSGGTDVDAEKIKENISPDTWL